MGELYIFMHPASGRCLEYLTQHQVCTLIRFVSLGTDPDFKVFRKGPLVKNLCTYVDVRPEFVEAGDGNWYHSPTEHAEAVGPSNG